MYMFIYVYYIYFLFVHTICSWVDSGKADLHPWWNTALGHMPYRHLESFFDDVMSTCFRELKMHYSYSPYKKTSRGCWWKSYRPQLGQLCSTTFQEMRSTIRSIFSEMTKSKCWVGILKFSGSGDPSRLLTFGWRLSKLILSLVRGHLSAQITWKHNSSNCVRCYTWRRWVTQKYSSNNRTSFTPKEGFRQVLSKESGKDCMWPKYHIYSHFTRPEDLEIARGFHSHRLSGDDFCFCDHKWRWNERGRLWEAWLVECLYCWWGPNKFHDNFAVNTAQWVEKAGYTFVIDFRRVLSILRRILSHHLIASLPLALDPWTEALSQSGRLPCRYHFNAFAAPVSRHTSPSHDSGGPRVFFIPRSSPELIRRPRPAGFIKTLHRLEAFILPAVKAGDTKRSWLGKP